MGKKLLPILLLLLIGHAQKSFAILTPQVDSILMSDGKKLAADIYKPAGITQGPVLLVQTPYNRLLYRFGLPLGIALNVNSSNYIIVVVDWRGFYGSKASAYVGAPSMGQDGYNCVEWIAQQTWSNGKIGTWGPSALGRVQFQTAKLNPPHLTCICPLVAGPQYDFTEYYPGGCIRTEYIEQLGALGFGYQPTMTMHPTHDAYWTVVENTNYYPASIQVPTLMIGGWYDHTIEFMVPFFSALTTSSPVAVRNKHRLLLGPWVHGGHGTAQVGSETQGQLSYPNQAGWPDSIALRFFDYHLRGISNGWDATPVVQYYQMGENTWQTASAWPPSNTTTDSNFYMHANGGLDNTFPNSTTETASFNYDPTDPSPTIGGPTLRNDLVQGPYDQVPDVEGRADILKYTTAALVQNISMKGNAIVHLKVSSDKKDTDFDIRLTDVYPDGRSMLVVDGVQRMRYLNGYRAVDTAALVPNQVYDCTIQLPNSAITFLAGHKIRVDITSSNYPRFNRNMNTDGAMYPNNSLDTLVNPLTAANTIYLNSTSFSYITLPVATNIPLATTLLSFNAVAQGGQALLTWKLAPNNTTQHFTIEKSANGGTWTTWQTLTASQGKADYAITDIQPFTNKTYYRLKLSDKDGSHLFSVVRTVDIGKSAALFYITPNPATNAIAVHLNTDIQNGQLSIFDASGKKVYATNADGACGEKITVLTNMLSPGIYTLSIKTATGSYTERLVIAK